jgi:hypothetical protein
MTLQLLGLLGSLVLIGGDIPYILDTFAGKTKPQRITWGVVFLLNIIGFLNQYASGARNSLWLFGAGVLVTGTIFLSSLWFGAGGRSWLDFFAIAFSLVGVYLWLTLKEPLISVIANAVVAVVCLIPTYKKAWKQPHSETVSAYFFGAISCVLGALSVGKLELALLLLPITSATLQIIMVAILQTRKRALA